MPQYDPDYDDSYLDEMDYDLKLEVDAIMQTKAEKQAREVYDGMAAKGIKRYNPIPQAFIMHADTAAFCGGPEDGKLIALPERTYHWIVVSPLPPLTVADFRSDAPTMVTIKRGIYKLDGVVQVGSAVYRAFIWQGWDGD